MQKPKNVLKKFKFSEVDVGDEFSEVVPKSENKNKFVMIRYKKLSEKEAVCISKKDILFK
jgi:hypothetical protein